MQGIRGEYSSVKEAMSLLANLVREQNGGDSNYFRNQYNRYLRSVERITQICPIPGRVLDVGSHYLHQSTLLSALGYEVYGIDVPLFTEADFVVERSNLMKIKNFTVDSLENGDFLSGCESSFDLVIFTEVLEHITFNPIRFWRRIYELLSEDGLIYLTTPNSLRPARILRTLFRLGTFSGIGPSLKDIFGNITYGHHWKEYSGREIRQYFNLLSPDFQVELRRYSDLPESGLRRNLVKVLGVVPQFRSGIEAVVRLSGKTEFQAKAPKLPMMKSRDLFTKSEDTRLAI